MASLLVPSHIRISGQNIAPKLEHVTPDKGVWAHLHEAWLTDPAIWTDWIRPQIDYSIGNLGCNCIRLISGNLGVYVGDYTQAQHDGLWAQLAGYLADRKCYLYPALGQGNFYTVGYAAGASAAWVASSISATLTVLADYPNIIGVDVLQEAGSWAGDTAIFCNEVYANVKSAHPEMPLTFSAYKHMTTYADMKTWFASINHDFLDFHFYPSNYPNLSSPITATDLNYWRQTYPNEDILFGEAGIPQSNTDAEKAAFLKALYKIANEDSRVRGILGWAANDQDVVTNNQWGVYNTSWVERPAKAQIMRAYSRGACVSRLA